jgi:hypothetical protein
MKPYDMVSSFRGANTLLQGQQNKGRRDRREKTEKRDHRRRTEKADQQGDKSRSQKTRSPEIQG